MPNTSPSSRSIAVGLLLAGGLAGGAFYANSTSGDTRSAPAPSSRTPIAPPASSAPLPPADVVPVPPTLPPAQPPILPPNVQPPVIALDVCGFDPATQLSRRTSPAGWGDTLRLYWFRDTVGAPVSNKVRVVEKRTATGWRCQGIVVDWASFAPSSPSLSVTDTNIVRYTPGAGPHGWVSCSVANRTRGWFAWPGDTLPCAKPQADSGMLVLASITKPTVRYEVLVTPCGHPTLMTRDTSLFLTSVSGAQSAAARGLPPRCPRVLPAPRTPAYPTRRQTLFGDNALRFKLGAPAHLQKGNTVNLNVGDSIVFRQALIRK